MLANCRLRRRAGEAAIPDSGGEWIEMDNNGYLAVRSEAHCDGLQTSYQARAKRAPSVCYALPAFSPFRSTAAAAFWAVNAA